MQNLSIGQVAQKADVNIQTIRYYERIGLLPKPQRRESGYRQFSPDDVHRIQFIKHAQAAGFLLKEIKDLLALKVDSETTCDDVRERTEIKIAEIDKKIRHLQQMKQTLENLTIACSGTGPTGDCPILEAFESEHFGEQS
jgi:MerR family mercuric resistance operon transcriptional regulator